MNWAGIRQLSSRYTQQVMVSKQKILFLCTGNCCRSQMAEALLRHCGGDRFEAHSAGSHPAGYVHPLSIKALARMGIGIEGQTSKSWDAFATNSMDVVITVCDNAAKEICPVWPGQPLTAHWPLTDPAMRVGTDQELLAFTISIAERLRVKIEAIVRLDWTATPETLSERLNFLGEI